MQPLRIHFGGERNVKNNETNCTNSAAASSSKQSSSICLEEPAEKKGKKRTAWSRSRYECAGTWYVPHEHLWQPTTNKLEAGPAAKGRDNEGQMRRSLLRSCRDVGRPRHLPNAAITAVVQSHPDGTTENKYRISETPRPGRYTRTKIK